jgi:TolA-binding protein
VENGKWNCVSCRYERLQVLEEKLRDAQIRIEELQQKNEALEEQLLLVGNRKMLISGTQRR